MSSNTASATSAYYLINGNVADLRHLREGRVILNAESLEAATAIWTIKGIRPVQLQGTAEALAHTLLGMEAARRRTQTEAATLAIVEELNADAKALESMGVDVSVDALGQMGHPRGLARVFLDGVIHPPKSTWAFVLPTTWDPAIKGTKVKGRTADGRIRLRADAAWPRCLQGNWTVFADRDATTPSSIVINGVAHHSASDEAKAVLAKADETRKIRAARRAKGKRKES